MPVVSIAIAVIGVYISWKKWRRDVLRTDDVLAWANEVIAALQTVVLICELDEPRKDGEPPTSKLTEVIFSTSILIERGRMFFKKRA